MPRHVMPARKGGRIETLCRVCDHDERPDGTGRPFREDPGTQGARQPPELAAVRVRRRDGGVDQEEQEGRDDPDLER